MEKKILIVFGTRPEAIKLCPLVKELRRRGGLSVKVGVTAQHREMLDQVLQFFEVIPDYDLNIMSHNQDLYDITAKILVGLRDIAKTYQPDLVIVQGDTTTTFATALAAFYQKIKVAHVEAGLRTFNKYEPYPEEINRQMTTRLADYHFAVTETNRQYLLKENINEQNIYVVGNTVIDALLFATNKIETDRALLAILRQNIGDAGFSISANRPFILITGHRRESFGEGFVRICEAIREIACMYPDMDVVYPVHRNPNVTGVVHKMLDGIGNVYLIDPLQYEQFVHLMNSAFLVITDSGGVQEEAPSLGKPVLVMRDITERTEGVKAGAVLLVGTQKEVIVEQVRQLIDHPDVYSKMQKVVNPYGDGKSCQRIADALVRTFE